MATKVVYTTENMSISLPKEMKERVKRRVEQDHYGTPSDYVRSLIREDFRRRDQERLESALLDGLESGHGVAIRAEGDWKKFWNTLDMGKSEKRVTKHA
jgi:antitoxin ParD1/3/4